MKLAELVKIANRNLLRNKLRTLLTILAIFTGSFTLVLTNGLGDGLRDYVENQVKDREGKNVLFVRKQVAADAEPQSSEPPEYKAAEPSNDPDSIDPNSYLVSFEQMENLLKDFSEVKTWTPRYSFDGEYIALDNSKKYRVELGMLSPGIVQKCEAGKMIDGANQIVLPLAQAQAFDRNINNLIGKRATIAYKIPETGETKTLALQIVGVTTKGLFTNYNSFVDSQTARKIYKDQNRLTKDYNRFSGYTLQLTSGDAALAAFKRRLEEKGFAAETFADQKKRTYDAINILQTGLNLFAFIALLAASFGIINTLIIAVMERTKEIGLQKALGMPRGTIFLLFALESMLIGFWGAILGVAVGVAVGLTVNFALAQTYAESFEGYNLFVFTVSSIAFVVALVSLIAFLAGVLPAFRASRLNPIEALRYE